MLGRFFKNFFKKNSLKSVEIEHTNTEFSNPIRQIQYAIWQRDYTKETGTPFLVECFLDNIDPMLVEPLLSEDELKQHNLHPRLKLSKQFFNTLKPEFQTDPRLTAKQLVRAVNTCKGNRKSIEEWNRIFGLRHPIEFRASGEPKPCKQARDFATAKHLVGTAYDLPLPGCDARFCDCMYHPKIDF